VLITGGQDFSEPGWRVLSFPAGTSQAPAHQLVLADLAPPAADVAAIHGSVPGPALCSINASPGQRGLRHGLPPRLAVSAECEADLDLGLRSNVDTTRALLDGLRGEQTRLVFSSSVAVFGGDADLPMPRLIHDDNLAGSQTSYGIQKFICEQLIADFTRRGLIDGRSTRLMTVTVRPGRPNAAASGFLSSIIREPLNGQEAVCPVPTKHLGSLGLTAAHHRGPDDGAEATPDAWAAGPR